MADNSRHNRTWHPLDEDILNAIDDLFADIYPESEYGELAENIADYWIDRLVDTWKAKPQHLKKKDLSFDPEDPLSRIFPRTVVIAYPDSVYRENEPSLETLDRFLDCHFPSVGGLHVLPACRVVDDRFNDGYFSQVKRDVIHDRFGTNEAFSRMMEKYYSMADFVLNHVDIENPCFKAYLEGDDDAGQCFYVYSEDQYQRLKRSGAFDQVFRPRPFPLFTIFRRSPADEIFEKMDLDEKCAAVNEMLGAGAIDDAVIKILALFDKIINDQTLLDDDYRHIEQFRAYLENRGIAPDIVFRLSQSQESTNPPYIFSEMIRTRCDLLTTVGYDVDDARRIARGYEFFDPVVFGEQIRAMTTFSHVQADVNTSTFEGLKMIADDFSWYLGMDINMLRLDAANYAFKKFHTSCFGLPEVKKLMKILYLSMTCVSPRMVANLEVNDRLDVVLNQMADRVAPPPMMYDFHLPCMLPVVFNSGDARILRRIDALQKRYDIPPECIRFSLAESHDGKSVRGSMGLLRFSERWMLAETVVANKGRIKYKSVPTGLCSASEFREICRESGIEYNAAVDSLFLRTAASSPDLKLKDGIKTIGHICEALGLEPGAAHEKKALLFFADKVLRGREPYELCCSTRDALTPAEDEAMAAARFLGFYTLAFALMGRNVKSIYFNDMAGLPNDLERMEKTGEYRDIKRTRRRFSDLEKQITDRQSIHSTIAAGIATLIRIVDQDMALHPRGTGARTISSGNRSAAVVYNRFHAHHTLVVVNVSGASQDVRLNVAAEKKGLGLPPATNWTDNVSGKSFRVDDGCLSLEMDPYERLWLKPDMD